MNGKTIRIILALILIGVGFAMMGGVIKLGRPGISPTFPRAVKELEAMLRPTPAPASAGTTHYPTLNFTATSEGTKITFTDTRPEEPVFFGYTVHEIPLEGALKLGDGSVSLDHITRGVADPAAPFEQGQSSTTVPSQFFDNKLEPIPDETVRERFKNEWERRTYIRDWYSQYRFSFAATNAPEIKLLRGDIRDARTGGRISHGYHNGSGGGHFQFGPGIGMWHRAPVVLILDIAHGPVETEDVPAAIGTVVQHALGEMKLVAKLEGRNHGMSSTSGSGGGEVTIHSDSKETGSSLLFYGLPYSGYAPVDFQFISSKGQLLNGSGTSSSYKLSVMSVDGPADEVATIRVRKYPHLKRLVVRLPYLPGLPPENDNVRDLLNVRAPFVRFRGDWEMRTFVQLATQASVHNYSWAPPPQGAFPVSYTNVTPREILEEIRRLNIGAPRIVIDERDNKIEFRPPFLKDLFRKFGF